MDTKRIWISATRKDGFKVEGLFGRVRVQEEHGRFWVVADGREFICDKVVMETKDE